MPAQPPDQPQVTTVFLCKSAMLEAGWRHMLAGTSFVIKEASVPAAGNRSLKDARPEADLYVLDFSLNAAETSNLIRELESPNPDARVVVVSDVLDLDTVT